MGQLKYLTAISCIILCTLGTWQVYRLQWKNDLIHTYQAYQDLPPVNLDTLKSPGEYQKVILTGSYLPVEPLFLAPRVFHRQVGGHVLLPFKTQQGLIVLVNLGWLQNPPKEFIPKGLLTGIIRLNQKQSSFAPVNTPTKNQWSTIDLEAFSHHWDSSLEKSFYVELSGPGTPGQPTPLGSTKNFTNNHLMYAITWFTLAFLCVLFSVFSGWKRKSS